MGRFISELKRTHSCGELGVADVGKQVVLMGWAQRRRDHGGLIFVDLRDREGITQVVFNPEISGGAHSLAHQIRSEYCLAVRGVVRRRPAGMENPKIPTGEVEVYVEEFEILNPSRTPPFKLEEWIEVGEDVRLRYRYMDLRRPGMLRNLRLRHKAAAAARSYLDAQGFIEVETPFLTRSTPEGARDFLVPSRLAKGRFYALPQSPQLFKQLLMVAGFERYYQLVRCFRDEDLRADRQPEFTQLDLEMSFVDEADVMAVTEGVVAEMLRAMTGSAPELPFPRISYDEAIARYGLDTPDRRFGMELVDLTELAREVEFRVFREPAEKGGVVKAINARSMAERLSRKDLDDLTSFVQSLGGKGMAWVKVKASGEWASPIAKFIPPAIREAMNERLGAREGDVLLFGADEAGVVATTLGRLRLKVAEMAGLMKEGELSFCWVTDFPLVEYNPEEGRYEAVHHPFTAPRQEHEELLETDPARVRARAYDLVLNGTEIGGGSIRIHRLDLQERIFKLLGIAEDEAREKFGFLLEALAYGAPPHGGLALGFDRLVAEVLGLESIREVIAFPKTQKGACLLTGAPGPVEAEQLVELGIRVVKSGDQKGSGGG